MISQLDRAPLPRVLRTAAERLASDDSALHRRSPNEVAALVWAAALGAGLLVLLFAFNIGRKDVSLVGYAVGVPLALQWLVAFVAGVVVALRIKYRQERTRRARHVGQR